MESGRTSVEIVPAPYRFESHREAHVFELGALFLVFVAAAAALVLIAAVVLNALVG